ncbi:hypothetical protein CR513_06595, partial [Mucuna pruriens]
MKIINILSPRDWNQHLFDSKTFSRLNSIKISKMVCKMVLQLRTTIGNISSKCQGSLLLFQRNLNICTRIHDFFCGLTIYYMDSSFGVRDNTPNMKKR